MRAQQHHGSSSLAASGSSLRQRQKDSIFDMIRTAVPLSNSSPLGSFRHGAEDRNHHSTESTSCWRLLIYDTVGRDIIAPLVKVRELREMGVTLYMNIDKPRDAVPGAPAVYFVAPTEHNVRAIANDCALGLYEAVFINFTSQVSRPLLEFFAEQLASSGKLESIRHIKVFDRTLSFVALASDLFTLQLPSTFFAINSRTTTEAAMEKKLDEIVMGLSHVFLSTQTLPFVAYVRSGAAEEVAKRLCQSLHDAVDERLLVPTQASAVAGRPVLLIADRSYDIASALHHPFTYRGLLVDAMGMTLNKVDVSTDGKELSFELDPDLDAFYRSNAFQEFGVIGEHVEAALAEYKKEYAALSSAGSSNNGHDDLSSGQDTMSRMLASAPKLAEKKRSVDAHLTLAYSILKRIKEAELDGFHGIEKALMQREGLDRDHFEKLMTGPSGSYEDKQRLYLVAYLLATSEGDVADVERLASFIGTTTAGGAAQASGPSGANEDRQQKPFPALQYLKHLRNWTVPGGANSDQAAATSNAAWGFAQSLARTVLSSAMRDASDSDCPLTKLVDALLHDPASSGRLSNAALSTSSQRAKLLENIVCVDPRTSQAIDVQESKFAHAYAFVVGGACIHEYDNLKAWERRVGGGGKRTVIYGGTDITVGKSMLAQLNLLWQE